MADQKKNSEDTSSAEEILKDGTLSEVQKKVAQEIRDARAEKRRQRQKARRTRITVSAVVLALLLVGALALLFRHTGNSSGSARRAEKESIASAIAVEESEIQAKRDKIAEAQELAKGYDYDGAIALLEAEPNSSSDSELVNAIAQLTAEKATLEAKDCSTVPHIYFLPLIVDPELCFDSTKWTEDSINNSNAWRVTADEFDKILQSLYDNGWVLVRMRDLVTQTTDADGTVHFSQNNSLMLPSGKKPLVLSFDDWSYYHTYEGRGFADRAVLDENGDVKVEYTDADGNTETGDYDVVPKIESFIREHPDFSYKGARGLIALTGYDGVFGCRTDTAYKTGENLDQVQKDYLAAHPDFDWNEEVSSAKKIADALKEEGWEFACHTWGHVSVADRSAEDLRTDFEKWQNTVGNIVGTTDTILFAHGSDIGTWRAYDASTNAKYAYYKSVGINFYANTDASAEYWIQIGKGYVRQGRIDVDGSQMWREISGEAGTKVLSALFDVENVFDRTVRPTPVEFIGRP